MYDIYDLDDEFFQSLAKIVKKQEEEDIPIAVRPKSKLSVLLKAITNGEAALLAKEDWIILKDFTEHSFNDQDTLNLPYSTDQQNDVTFP